MFNLGSNDKEKLKENMEEIKNLVNNQQSSEEETEEKTSQDAKKPDFSQMNQEAAENNNFNQQGMPPANEGQNTAETQESVQDDLSQDNFSQKGFSQGNSNNESEDFGQNSQQTSTFANNPQMAQQNSMPEQEEEVQNNSSPMTKANFSSKSGETIFLTVERFEQLQDRIEEMRYLSSEIEDVIDHLEAGVQEDDQTQGEAQQLLDDFSSRRGDVESIITSQEK